MKMNKLVPEGMTKKEFKIFCQDLTKRMMNEEQKKRKRYITNDDINYLNKVLNAPDVNIFLQLI